MEKHTSFLQTFVNYGCKKVFIILGRENHLNFDSKTVNKLTQQSSECHSTECRYAKCRSAKERAAKCFLS